MKTIEIDDDLLELLKRHAEPFVDTPNDVLRRLLFDEDESSTSGRAAEDRAGPSAPGLRAKRGKSKPSKKPSARKRAPSGALLSEHAYELPLLEVLDAAGGRMPTREAVAAVGERIGDQLMPMDHDVLEHGRERWEMRVQFVRLRLVEAGLLEKESPRGVWEISDAGRERIKHGTAVAA
jgi:Mrr restriction endonuclease-like protein/SeqA-like protein